MAQAIAVAIGILGIAGVIFTALKYNRDDTTAVISQQAQILAGMATLNSELRQRNAELKEQIADLHEEVKTLRAAAR